MMVLYCSNKILGRVGDIGECFTHNRSSIIRILFASMVAFNEILLFTTILLFLKI